MTNRLTAAIAVVSQLSESEQDAIAALILEKLRSTSNSTLPAYHESAHQPLLASDQITGLFADEPELMEHVIQSIGHDRHYDRPSIHRSSAWWASAPRHAPRSPFKLEIKGDRGESNQKPESLKLQ